MLNRLSLRNPINVILKCCANDTARLLGAETAQNTGVAATAHF